MEHKSALTPQNPLSIQSKPLSLLWYVKRLGKMSPKEIFGRIRDQGYKAYWRKRQIKELTKESLSVPHTFQGYTFSLKEKSYAGDKEVEERLRNCAELLLQGQWKVFDQTRTDMVPTPDWFLDVRTGRRAPQEVYAFDIRYRDEEQTGNIKYIWELSRHQYLTVLASAYYVTHDSRYSEFLIHHLQSWWKENPFLSGPHWISGIEIGIRLISWVWIRRLLHSCPAIDQVFEHNPVFIQQLYHHQEYLNAFMSHGSSANNHVIAEASGLFASCCNFPYFKETETWRRKASEVLKKEIQLQTFPDGLNRELATDYHCFVLELMLAAAIEGDFCGHPLNEEIWSVLRGMIDALGGLVDIRYQVSRQGDSDDGVGLLLDSPEVPSVQALLATGKILFGESEWWPSVETKDFRTQLWSQMATRRVKNEGRPLKRPSCFPEAGVVIFRFQTKKNQEIWCRCDHGPHGYPPLNAHAHADALSIEVRVNGVPVFVDPGTYCYHGDSSWRSYFRSTIGHNTLELAGCNQIEMSGPFMWDGKIESTLVKIQETAEGGIQQWSACHNGYRRLSPPATHYRSVSRDSLGGGLLIEDKVTCAGEHPGRLAYHLGPSVFCVLQEGTAFLKWNDEEGGGEAQLMLPESLEWSLVRGMTTPPLGWYSPAFDVKVPSNTLIGTGLFGEGRAEYTKLMFQ